MNIDLRYASVWLILLSALSCQTENPTDEAAERNAILQMHEAQREQHFNKMTDAFVGQFSPNYLAVNRGQISQPSAEESLSRFGNYFEAVTFHKWDDLSKPIIRFSDDYSMAYTTVHKEVIVSYETTEQETIMDTTQFAWVAIYKKYPDGWKIDCVASTDQAK